MKTTRRWFLRGMGAALAIPALPSLLKGKAAEAAVRSTSRFFVHLGTHHGGAWGENMHPATPAPSMETMSYAGRTVRRAPLVLSRDGQGNNTLSPVLTAAPTLLTDRLASKMFVLHGLDIPFYIAHHEGGYLGNFAAGGNATAQAQAARPTIDQLMAWSPSFYPDLSGTTQRSVTLTRACSFDYANPSARTGAIQEVGPTADTPLQLFQALFPAAQPTSRGPIVDKVLESYHRARSNPRISAEDKIRLDDHVQRISELQRRIGTVVSCAYPPAPVAPHANSNVGRVVFSPPYAQHADLQQAWFQAVNDLIVAAFACGLTQIVNGIVGPTFVDTYPANEWHQGVAHRAREADGVQQGVLCSSYRTFFQGVLLDLASKMDAVSMPSGGSLLDQALVTWTQECGIITHHSRDSTVVGFGGAGGFLRTGQVCDYRNQDLVFDAQETHLVLHPGLLWHQWLGTVLQAMGIPKSEYERPATNVGYPDFKYMASPSSLELTPEQAYPEAVWSAAGDVLPFLRP